MSGTYGEWVGDFEALMGLLDSDEVYSGVRSALSRSRGTLSMNHRIMEKTIDEGWVETLEKGLSHVDNVMRNPRKTIVDVEEVVPIALSKKITVESIKHLAQHTDLIQSVDPITGKITPSKVLNVHKEESLLTYENKFVNTLIDRLYIFVNRRYEKLKAASANEEVFVAEYDNTIESDNGSKMKLSIKIETSDSLDTVDENGSTMWDRVEKLRQVIESYKASPFCQEMGANYIRPPVMRTNAILKNVDLKACLILWQYIESYDKVGYEINVSDAAQKPEQGYVDDLVDLAALNLVLFRSYTQARGKQAEVLKTKNGRAASPRIVRKLDDINTEEYNLAVNKTVGEPFSAEPVADQELPSDADEILAQIDKIIEIETEFFKAEERRRLEAEERERKRREEEQRRLEEEQRLEEERRLAQEKAEREERERIERERLEAERIERERIEREEQERLEQERIERERAEQEEQQRLDAEREELGRIMAEEREKLEAEREARKAIEEQKRLEREERETVRAQKLKTMREQLESKTFSEIYAEYSRNPLYVIRRGAKRLVSLIKGDGSVIREGDSDNPMLVERIAAEYAAKQEAEREKIVMAEMQVLYDKYIPTFTQRTKKLFKKVFGKKRRKVYVMPKEMPVQRDPWEQRAYTKKMHALFKKYHVSFIQKIIRRIKKEY